jgi:prepilin-type N-terminal cleavage/methylation domain-containing protein
MQTSRRSQSGFSLVETTIVLMVMSALSSVMVPASGDFVADARSIRARSDSRTIAVRVRHLSGRNGLDTFVLSAGPRGIIGTPSDVDGVTPRGDDIIALVSAGD